jgi:hypothetical protein
MKQMKLADFIAQTVTEIIDGVARAQEYAKGKGASVNPPHVNWSDTKQAFYLVSGATGPDQAPHLTPIDFDILLTIGEDGKVQGGIGVFAASLGIGVKGEARDYSEAVNRIKFQILAKLPQQT